MINFYLWFAKYIIAGIAITALDIYIRADSPLEVIQEILSNWVYAQDVMSEHVQWYVFYLVLIVGVSRGYSNKKITASFEEEFKRDNSPLTTIQRLLQKQWGVSPLSIQAWPLYGFFLYNYCMGMSLYRGGIEYLFIQPMISMVVFTPLFLFCYWIKATQKRLNAGEIEGGISIGQGK